MVAQLVETPELRNKREVFRDRTDAGRRLGELLCIAQDPPVPDCILAVPSGGVPVGIAAAAVLDLPLDLAIVRKLQIPGNTEAGFGALALDGELLINHALLPYLNITAEQIEAEEQRVRQELERRNALFRGGRPLPDVAAKDVLLVDDGLASGFTLLAAARSVRAAGARSVSAGVPTAPLRSVAQVERDLDTLYCLNVVDRTGPFAVAGAYSAWRDLETDEVVAMLRSAGIYE